MRVINYPIFILIWKHYFIVWMLRSHVSPGSLFVKRDFVYNGRSYHQFLPLKQRGGLQAAALPVTPPLLDDEIKRQQMSEDYGFKQIGEQLPDNVTLKDVMDTMPKEVPTTNTSYAVDVSLSCTQVLVM